MNNLEKYKFNQSEIEFPEEGEDSIYCDTALLHRTGFVVGFESALSLNLPVKFLEWYTYELSLWSRDKVEEDVYDKLGKDGLTDAEWYDYWINNIFKPE